ELRIGGKLEDAPPDLDCDVIGIERAIALEQLLALFVTLAHDMRHLRAAGADVLQLWLDEAALLFHHDHFDEPLREAQRAFRLARPGNAAPLQPPGPRVWLGR